MVFDLIPFYLIVETPSSSSSRMYRTGVSKDGIVVCNCMGWGRRKGKSPRQCIHTDALLDDTRMGLRGTAKVTGADSEYFAVPVTIAQTYDQSITLGKAAKKSAKSAKVAAPKVVSSTTSINIPPEPDFDRSMVMTRTFGGFRTFSIAETESPFVEPMLASHLDSIQDFAKFDASEWVMEEKYDGHRVVMCVTDGVVKAWSRPKAGEEPKAKRLPDYIINELAQLPSGTYDGEMIVDMDGGTSSDVTALENANKLFVFIFDIMYLLGHDTTRNTYQERRSLLKETFSRYTFSYLQLSKVMPLSWETVEAVWAVGKEGVIIKKLKGEYIPGGRRDEFIKVKKEQSVPVTIIGFKAGKLGPCARLLVRDDDGLTTTVKTPDNKTLAAAEADPKSFINRRMRMQYQDKTPTGGYRHPRFDRWEN